MWPATAGALSSRWHKGTLRRATPVAALTALTVSKMGDYANMRHMHVKQPTRPVPSTEPAEAQDCPESCLCPQRGRLAAQH